MECHTNCSSYDEAGHYEAINKVRDIIPKRNRLEVAIQRGTADLGAINYSQEVLESEEILAIYPEGTRSKTGEPMRAKAGVSLLAYSTQCDVLPVSVYCKGRLRLFKKYTVRIGDVIPYENLGITAGKPSELKLAANFIMEKITDLWSTGH